MDDILVCLQSSPGDSDGLPNCRGALVLVLHLVFFGWGLKMEKLALIPSQLRDFGGCFIWSNLMWIDRPEPELSQALNQGVKQQTTRSRHRGTSASEEAAQRKKGSRR